MTTITRTQTLAPGILLDLGALLLVYFTPAISHLLSFPLYLIEPMRLAVVLALVHTRQRNAWLLALTLPLFSFAVSAHPHFIKMLLITGELALNVWLFFYLSERLRTNKGVSLALSILLSKGVYYLAKFLLISALLIEGSVISTPLWIQGITLTVFALYMGIAGRKTA
jgi:hypothetical protein